MCYVLLRIRCETSAGRRVPDETGFGSRPGLEQRRAPAKSGPLLKGRGTTTRPVRTSDLGFENRRKRMKFVKPSRRTVIGSAAGVLGAGVLPRWAWSQGLTLPTSPVALNVIDVAGNLALTQKAFEAYRKAKPNLVSRI